MPDFAIVPRFSTISDCVMPMPLSATVMVLAFASKSIDIFSSLSSAVSSGFCKASTRSLSSASDAFEISSRKKTSLFEYRELIMM